ncbi:hypothetical protein I4U23_004240 [Adineta vaga]|nr:hypothetical protein I4U23_004240 [Adineta vaga]
MKNDDDMRLETEESLVIQVEEPVLKKKNSIRLWCRHIFTLDVTSNEKHHFPIFIIIMSILHISIHLTKYINVLWRGQLFSDSLTDLLFFNIPCMRPTAYDLRMRIVSCRSAIQNTVCYYDDQLKKFCFSFLYPHQLWRMITVNLVHISWLHLSSNLSRQILCGILLERKYGSIRIIIVYWLSELGASLSSMLIDSRIPGIGSSGALYGVLIFFLMERLSTMKANSGHRIYIVVQLLLLVGIPMTIGVSILFILKINAAHSAHIGGGSVGFLFGIGMFGCPCLCTSEHGYYQMICRRTAFAILFLYFIISFIIFFHIEAPLDPWISFEF